jgi:acetoin utilization deacetylase AcuC-like enzyme
MLAGSDLGSEGTDFGAEASRGLLVVDDPLFDEHRAAAYHPERPERLTAARRALAACEEGGLRVVRLAPRDATVAELSAVHDAPWLDRLERLRGERAAIDDDTFVAPRSIDAAVRAVGGGLALVDALLDGGEGAPRLGLALLRPPGHHATPAVGMGFCLLNNVAAAAAHALSRGLSRVAIVDWDVHHGNGTQDAFYRDGRVLFVSLHQWPMYPGTGAASQTGEGDGRGRTINIPLSRGATDAVYASAMEQIVVPALLRFRPELILVSAGFDAHARDPLADMALSDEGYRAMAAALRQVALATTGGRVGVFLEGGYDLAALEASLVATIEGLLGVPSSHEAPSPSHDRSHAAEIELARSYAAAAGAL